MCIYGVCLCSVYSGHQSILIPPLELEAALPLWLSTLSQYRIRDTFCSYSVMELCTKGLGTQTAMLKVRSHKHTCKQPQTHIHTTLTLTCIHTTPIPSTHTHNPNPYTHILPFKGLGSLRNVLIFFPLFIPRHHRACTPAVVICFLRRPSWCVL